jgi:hypothetical protein
MTKQPQSAVSEVQGAYKRLRPYLKKNGKIRNTQAISLLGVSEKDDSRGILTKLVEIRTLVAVSDASGTEEVIWYFSNEDGFYPDSERLISFIPQSELSRITDQINGEPRPIQSLSRTLYGDPRGERGANFIATVLDYYVSRGLVKQKKRLYSLSSLGYELGIDAQSITTLNAAALENQLLMNGADNITFGSLDQVERALADDLGSKIIQPFDVTKETNGDSFRLLFIVEMMYGNQFTAQKLLSQILRRVTPDITIASGLVQGNYLGYRGDKARVLAWKAGLQKLDAQFSAARRLNERLERITKGRVFNVAGDDDWDLAQSYARLIYKAEKDLWRYGLPEDGLSTELQARLRSQSLYRLWDIQWEIIGPYEYRIGRSLMSKKQVHRLIGIWKSEYRLIIEILVAKKKGFDYPKIYEKVVDVRALESNPKAKRIVTPDTLILKVGKREIQFVHNAAFSNITQYVDSLAPLEMTMRNLGARGEELPWIIADGHQERFHGTYLQGHWILGLPGLQNPLPSSRYRMKEFSTRVLSSKSHRQNTFRKEPVSPGAVDLELFKDGRVKFRIWNETTMRVLEEQRRKPHVKQLVALPTDLQHGSITMWPELEIKYMDYALYERRAQRCYENGDIGQGFIYPQHVAENGPGRLVPVDLQERFVLEIQMPLIIDAPALKDFLYWRGNHEWGIWGNALTGQSSLTSFEAWMKGYLAGRKKAGKPVDMRSMAVERIRWTNTHNPEPDKMNHPFFATEIAGFRLAMTHMWLPRGGGRTPVDQQRRWLYNMATAAGDIDVMIGGHWHSIWLAQVAGKVLVQMAASAGQSGYELHRGLMSTVMFTLVEFDNRAGVTVEFVPWEFLQNYKMQSPFYKGRDKDLERPKRGSPEYRHGKMSPLVDKVIDDLTQYLEV